MGYIKRVRRRKTARGIKSPLPAMFGVFNPLTVLQIEKKERERSYISLIAM